MVCRVVTVALSEVPAAVVFVVCVVICVFVAEVVCFDAAVVFDVVIIVVAVVFFVCDAVTETEVEVVPDVCLWDVLVVAVVCSCVLPDDILPELDVVSAVSDDFEVLVVSAVVAETDVVVSLVVSETAVVVSSGSRFRYTSSESASAPFAMLYPSRQVPEVRFFSSGSPSTRQPSRIFPVRWISVCSTSAPAYALA